MHSRSTHRRPIVLLATIVLALALGLAGCGDGADTDVSDGPSSTTTAPADAPASCTDDTWQDLAFDGLSFSLPGGMVDQEAIGIDSLVGAYEGEGMVVNFDFGWYSSDFSELDEFDAVRTEVVRDGRDATLIAADVGSSGGYGGRHVTALAAAVDGDEADAGGATRLALWIAYDDPALADTAECITTTVRFT